MSGMIMLRSDGGIIVASDGGAYVSGQDFTLTGYTSKPKVLPHLSAVICFCGSTALSALVELNHVNEWTSFDEMVDVFRENVVDEIYNVFRLEPYRDGLLGLFFIGGYSEARSRWESYSLHIDTFAEAYQHGAGELNAGHQFMVAPDLDAASLAQYGLDITNINVDWRNPVPSLIAIMRSMRVTPHYQGEYGEIADESQRAPIIGAFIEVVQVIRDLAITKVVWRWPDEIGKRIDTKNEGEPTYWGLPEQPDTQAAEE